MQTIDPASGKKIASYEETTPGAIEGRLKETQKAFEKWRLLSFDQRAEKMAAVATILRKHKKRYSVLMAMEMGKPVSQGESEIEKCALVCEFYAAQAREFLAPQMIETQAQKSFVSFQPLGIVLAVMPWNFPFWQVLRCAAPTLMAGNAMILKHASNVCGCALAIEEIFKEACFPDGLFRTLLIHSAGVKALIENPLVKAVTLTGSTAAGQAIAAHAGAVIKKTVLELGGSDAYLILEDADLDVTVNTCVASRLVNGGQSCVSAKRFIVVGSSREEFEKRFVEKMSAAVMDSPLLQETTLGPMARHDLRDSLHEQVLKSVESGARLLLGGEIPQGPGAFYPPTVLTDVKKGMPAYDEELFGPVASIIHSGSEKEAIAIANDTVFGLGAAVFTQNIARGEEIAAYELEAGCCFVNEMVKSDPKLPFGGIKQSGYGRELSNFGIQEFVNVKTVYVK
jgi:succinate-semialdehyde dehydrogenase/glutarate-semialdehyde dehydrogenase